MDKLFPDPVRVHSTSLGLTSCQVLLSDIEVMADIGALESEKGVLQPLRINVAVNVVPPVWDELAQTIDYCLIQSFAVELAAQRTVLIETFALKLAQRCLALDIALDVEVRIGKPQAVAGCLAGTCVMVSKLQTESSV